MPFPSKGYLPNPGLNPSLLHWLTLCFSCHLLGISSSNPSLWACLSLELRWVSCSQHILKSWFLNHPDTLCLLISESNLFKFRVIIDKLRLVPLFYLLFSGCSISLSPCVSVYHLSWMVSMMFFSVSSFSVSCLCSRFMFCDSYEVWKKFLIDKNILFLLTVPYLCWPIWILSFFTFLFVFLLSQVIHFLMFEVITNWTSFFCFFFL